MAEFDFQSFLDQYQGDGQPQVAGDFGSSGDPSSFQTVDFVPDGTQWSMADQGSGSQADAAGFDPFALAGKGMDAAVNAVGNNLPGAIAGTVSTAALGLPGLAIPYLLSKFGDTSPEAVAKAGGYALQQGADATGVDPVTGGPARGSVSATVTNPPGLSSASVPGFDVTKPFDPFSYSSGGGSLSPQGVGASGGSGDFFGGQNFFTDGASGYTPFVPDTMGLNNDLSSKYFDAASQFEKAAAEFDSAPLLQATSDSFARARDALQRDTEKRIGDLNASFERSRIQGSSLASGTMASAQKEFELNAADLANKEAQATAQVKLQEITTKADYASKATAARIAGTQAVIDNVFKTANLGAQNATVQAQLADSSNRLKQVLASLQEDMQKTQVQIAAQEAQSIRASVTNMDIAKLNAETQQKTNQVQQNIEQSKINADKSQGIGSLVGTVLAPTIGKVGNSIADSLFGTKPSSADYLAANLFGIGLPASKPGLFA